VAALLRNRWQVQTGMIGRSIPEWVAGWRRIFYYGTVPVNFYQLKDPTISLDMIGDAITNANIEGYVLDDGTVELYDDYLNLLGQEFNSSQYLSQGTDYNNLQDYLNSDYTMADYAIYGTGDNEHHALYRNNYDLIDPYRFQLSWSVIDSYRYRGLEWVNF